MEKEKKRTEQEVYLELFTELNELEAIETLRQIITSDGKDILSGWEEHITYDYGKRYG